MPRALTDATNWWRPRDLVMWDNRCLLHRAIPYDYTRYRRVLRRTTVAGSGAVVGPFSVGARTADRA